MILKGSQRGHARSLAAQLMNGEDNEHIEVHTLNGFLSDDLRGAFLEVEAVSKGTKCRQPFFSVSLSPPAAAEVSVSAFEDAAAKVIEANGLRNQPYALVFHEKDGRRHAHLVVSRIDATKLPAINLPHFKSRLQAVSRELFLENVWPMPDGLRDRRHKSPTNVTLAEWQAAKRRGKNAIDQKALIQQCWAASDSKAGFEAALKDYGYTLAKGDRRGHVIVCHDGEVFTVARATGLKAKDVRARLGVPDDLPSVTEAMADHARDVRGQFVRMAGEARIAASKKRAALDIKRRAMIDRHKSERVLLQRGQNKRWRAEVAARKARFQTGLAGVWQRISGKRAQISKRNEREAYDALKRDEAQKHALRMAQLAERREIEDQRTALRRDAFGLISDLRVDRDDLIERLLDEAVNDVSFSENDEVLVAMHTAVCVLDFKSPELLLAGVDALT